MTEPAPPRPIHEPAFNAPWPSLVVVAVILGLHAVQSRIGSDWPDLYGLRPDRAFGAGAPGLITYMGLHADWLHAGMNAIGALAFGAPLARRLGETARGGAAFLAYVVVGGALTGALYALIHAGSQTVLIGASGAVFTLVGASSRLMNPAGRLEPLFSRRVLGMTAAWIGANLIVAFLGVDPATGVRGVAWDAHLIGLALGLAMVGAWLRLFGLRRASPPPSPAPRGPWSDAPPPER